MSQEVLLQNERLSSAVLQLVGQKGVGGPVRLPTFNPLMEMECC